MRRTCFGFNTCIIKKYLLLTQAHTVSHAYTDPFLTSNRATAELATSMYNVELKINRLEEFLVNSSLLETSA